MYRTSPGLIQRRAALIRANEVRYARADIKQRVRAGEMTVREALEHPHCQTMKLENLLILQPGLGRVKTWRLIKRLGLRESIKVSEITPRQGVKLLAELRARFG